MLIRNFAFFGIIAAAACNPHNTQDACNDIARAYCQRIFDLSNQGCADATGYLADHAFESLNDCTSSFTFVGGAKCASIATNACTPEQYSADRAGACASTTGNLQCGYDWDSGPLGATPECAHICCERAGDPGVDMECCSGKSHLVTGGCGNGPATSVCD